MYLGRVISRTCKHSAHQLRAAMEPNPEELAEFFEAVKSNDLEKTVELLKTKKINVNSVDKTCHERTAIHIAAERNYQEMLRVLVNEFNADVNVVDKTEIGQLPIQLACDNYNIKIAKFLVEKNSALAEYAQRYLNDKLVDELFKAAASNDIPKVVELIKEKKVDVNSKDKGNYDRTILHVAAKEGHEDLVKILVDEFNADVMYEDQIGDSAKNMAVDFQHPDIAKFLIEKIGDKTSSY